MCCSTAMGRAVRTAPLGQNRGCRGEDGALVTVAPDTPSTATLPEASMVSGSSVRARPPNRAFPPRPPHLTPVSAPSVRVRVTGHSPPKPWAEPSKTPETPAAALWAGRFRPVRTGWGRRFLRGGCRPQRETAVQAASRAARARFDCLSLHKLGCLLLLSRRGLSAASRRA